MKTGIHPFKTFLQPASRLMLMVAFLIPAGCSEGFLDNPQEGTISEDSFYKTDDQALEALMAVFDLMQGGIQWSHFYLHMGLSDEAYAGGGQRGDNGGVIEEINEFRFGPDNRGIRDYFSFNYTGIYRCNKLIDNVSRSTENKTYCIAMAKALRAFFYYNLVTLWGDVPLVLHELKPGDYAQPRVNTSRIWNQIETDLSEAIRDLDVRSQMPELYRNLVSKGTAQALLARALLFENKFGEAADVLDALIASGEYDLIDDYTQIYRPSSEFGPESLFEISLVNNQSYLSWPGSESTLFTVLTSPRQNYFEGLGIIPGWGFYNPRRSLYDAYTAAGDTVRRNATMITEDELVAKGGRLRDISGNLPYACDGMIRIKYVMYEEDGGAPTPRANNGTNPRIIRYADVLLMAAEVLNRKSVPDDARACTYLNRVRDRVSLPPLELSGGALFEAIKNERRLELAFESVRYIDLLRWGDAPEVLKNQGQEIPVGNGSFLHFPEAGFKTGKNEVLPIPEIEMFVNENMVQNPGY
jgi:hypothetical protein